MKKLLFLATFAAGWMTITAASCKHDDNNNNPSGGGNTTTPGSGWRVSLFNERTENKTNDYSGYSFDFAANGSMTAVRNSQNTTGTWRQFQDDGVTKFEIQLSTTDHDLQELNDDWVLVSKTDNLISLQDDNSSSNEQLQFSK